MSNFMAVAEWARSLNWFDYAVIALVLTGIYSGLRAGVVRSAVWIVTWLLMCFVALLLYPTVGDWLHQVFGLESDSAHLQAFLLLGLLVYLPCRFVGHSIQLRALEHPLPAIADNIGGPLLGMVFMAVLAVWLCIVLTLMRSPFWHTQVARESHVGSRVVHWFPALDTVADKPPVDKPWFLGPIQRRQEPTPDSDKSRR